ncbi:zonadhesin isoform X3 [Bombyx mori]|uniref:TIL domain-containing protein n=1 Tax=Bombyx mori TaxID=7091 RepID=A0A8R2R937_BOMMO|nr:zonadhesin isoform X2 [Bombyx mori]
MGRFCFIVLTAAWLVVAKADATDDVTEPPCADSEILDKCPVDCPSDYCPTSRCDDQSSCPKPASADCPAPACKCRFNYRRAANGTCIPTRECPPFDCDGDNEEYNPCPPFCPGESCSQATEDGECHLVGRIGIVLPCKPACRCKKYFWRQDGVCVPYEQCTTCPENEERTCLQGLCRPQKCIEKNDIIFCQLVDEEKCEYGCACKIGYLRDENGTCIPQDKCPTVPCPVNEYFTNCAKGMCRQENCTELGKLSECKTQSTELCEPGCVCEGGFLRSKNGTCVSIDECHRELCPVNEVYSSCRQPNCNSDKCEYKYRSQSCPSDEPCEVGCVCKRGFRRADNGTCVDERDCESQLCSVNEQYLSCIQAVCRVEKCSDLGGSLSCKGVSERECVGGCVCKDNYFRAKNDTCIKLSDCDADLCSENEIHVNCVLAQCGPMTCSEKDGPMYCPSVDQKSCKAGCVCKEGYLKDDSGKCVARENCPNSDSFKTCAVNEQYSNCVQSVCRPEKCSNLGGSLTCTGVSESDCTGGCVCKDNYFRAKNGTCITVSDCDKECSGENEEFTNCTNPCPPRTCNSLVARFDCSKPKPCEEGCACKPDYLKLDDNSACVKICECPQMASSPDCPKL